MAEVKARFSLIDEMSDKLISMAECGQNMIGQWETANNSINTTMENAASGASNVVTALNGVSGAMDGIGSNRLGRFVGVSGKRSLARPIDRKSVV